MSPDPARIVFAGSPDFAVPALEILLRSGHEVVAVLTQPDRPAGRGRRIKTSPVKDAAVAAGVRVLQPLTLRDRAMQQELAALNADLMVVVAYGLLLPQAVLDQPRLGCVNLHASLLPRWRGAAPIQYAILSGDTDTGVSLMQMDQGLDTGPVYATIGMTIGERETAGELHDRLARAGADLLADNLDGLLAGSLTAALQASAGISYAGRINKADGLIDWQQSASAIDCQIRAYNPWPVAYTLYRGQPLRCWQALPDPATAAPAGSPAGKVIGRSEAGIAIVTGAGLLQLIELQLPGRKRLAAHDFANAHDLNELILGQ